MDIKTEKYRQKNFRGFLLSYLLILLLPLLVGSLVYKEALSIVEKDAMQTNLSILEQSKDVLDRRLSEIDSLAIQLGLNSKVNNLMNIKGRITGADVYKVRNTGLDLPPYLVSNNFIATFHIYLKDSGLILTPNGSYIRKEFFYGEIFKYSNMEEKEWYSNILGKHHNKSYLPSSPVIIDGKTSSVITYIQSIPFNSPDVIKGAIIIFIEETQLHKLLSRLYIANGGWAYIMDENERIIVSVADNMSRVRKIDHIPATDRGSIHLSISGEKITVSYITSSYNGWKYVAAVPTSVVMTKVAYIKRISYSIASVILFLGLIIACFMAYSKSKPLKDIIKILKDSVGNDIYFPQDEYDFLRGNILKLVENNKVLKNTIQQQIPVLRSTFIERILKGEFNNEEEIKVFSAQTGVKLNGDKYIVIILHIGEYNSMVAKDILEELNIQRIIVKNYLENIIGEKGQLQNVDDNKIAILLALDSSIDINLNDYINDLLESIYDELHRRYNLNMFFSVGNVCSNLLDIYSSFNEARQALEYRKKIRSEKRVLWYNSIYKENSENYFYPIETELRLINMVKAGNESEVKKILLSIYEENCVIRKLSQEMLKYMLYEIQGTFVKIFEDITIENQNQLKRLKKLVTSKYPMENGNISEVYNNIVEGYLDICRVLEDQKKSHNKKLIDSILGYVNSAYMNSDICLFKVADKFQLSETYLSHFFKEQTGENFSDYLEKLRMQKAHNLLSQTELSIEEIAEQVGYNSSDTFRKAFKRFYNVSPANYRNLVKTKIIPS